jgi:hypothetical protein
MNTATTLSQRRFTQGPNTSRSLHNSRFCPANPAGGMGEGFGLSHPSPGHHVAAIQQPVKGRDVTRGSGASLKRSRSGST